jgi:hypothetical protein
MRCALSAYRASRRAASLLGTIWTTRLRAGACPSEGVGGPNGSMDEFWLHDPLPFAPKFPKNNRLSSHRKF